MLSKTSEILTMSVFKSFNLLLKTSKCMVKDVVEGDLVKEASGVVDLVKIGYGTLALDSIPFKLLTLIL